MVNIRVTVCGQLGGKIYPTATSARRGFFYAGHSLFDAFRKALANPELTGCPLTVEDWTPHSKNYMQIIHDDLPDFLYNEEQENIGTKKKSRKIKKSA